MRHRPADPVRGLLELFEVGDSSVLSIANEAGDITADVRRADGSSGHSFGGPVYDPPQFMNWCERPDWLLADGRPPVWCSHQFDMTAAELATATDLARRVGWMP